MSVGDARTVKRVTELDFDDERKEKSRQADARESDI